jgi:hypothetical protein
MELVSYLMLLHLKLVRFHARNIMYAELMVFGNTV